MTNSEKTLAPNALSLVVIVARTFKLSRNPRNCLVYKKLISCERSLTLSMENLMPLCPHCDWINSSDGLSCARCGQTIKLQPHGPPESSQTRGETVAIQKTGTYFLDSYNSKKGVPCNAIVCRLTVPVRFTKRIPKNSGSN